MMKCVLVRQDTTASSFLQPLSIHIKERLCENKKRRRLSAKKGRIPEPDHIALRLPVSRTVRKKTVLFKPPSMWYFVMAAQQIKIGKESKWTQGAPVRRPLQCLSELAAGMQKPSTVMEKKINHLTWPLDEKLYSETLNLHSQRSLILLSQQPSILTSLQFNTHLSRKDQEFLQWEVQRQKASELC